MLKAVATVLAAILFVFFFAQPAAAATGVTVTSSSGVYDSSGYHISGEVRNDTPDAAGNVRVAAALLDSSGNAVASVAGNAFMGVLRPGENRRLP